MTINVKGKKIKNNTAKIVRNCGKIKVKKEEARKYKPHSVRICKNLFFMVNLSLVWEF